MHLQITNLTELTHCRVNGLALSLCSNLCTVLAVLDTCISFTTKESWSLLDRGALMQHTGLQVT